MLLHRTTIWLAILIVLFPALLEAQADKSTVLSVLEAEIARNMEILSDKGDPAPYFLGYDVTEQIETEIVGTYGSLRESSSGAKRSLDIDIRVGDYRLDNTRQMRGSRRGFSGAMFGGSERLPIEDDEAALRSRIWLSTDQAYRNAVERLIQVKANRSVNVDEQDTSADFSREDPVEAIHPLHTYDIDRDVWEEKVRSWSKLFRQWPDILESVVTFEASTTNKYTANSEGTSIQHGQGLMRVFVFASTKASDGEEIYLYRSFTAHDKSELPSDAEVSRQITEMAEQLRALRDAPFVEAYTGPAILSGRAGAVFFHETLGHRLEGHRQKDESSGQTFTKKVGEKILPEFMSIVDDPTRATMEGTALGGYYRYDDEGVAARPVTIVKDGTLKNFLMSRSPVEGFSSSNGHGRKAPGRAAVGRQGNFIVSCDERVSEDRLREMLIEECKEQDKPFGLIFEEISGGFTYTGRFIPQMFKVAPIIVWRVWTDGRPDELVRGLDLIGTPLTSISQIVACGEATGVFNGTCGAESGPVPVSGVSPSFLTSQIEVQKKAKSVEKPPILPAPDDDDPAAGEQPGSGTGR